MINQNFPTPLFSLLAGFGFALAALAALGQAPVISSLSQNGKLICTNLQPGSTASLEWASSPAGPWTNNWAGLDAVTVDSNGMIQVSVPMFYRVRGTPPPLGMSIIPAGSFTMGDQIGDWPPEWGQNTEIPAHTNYVSTFFMDIYEVTLALWNDVHQWATNHGYCFEYGAQGKTNNHPVHSVSWFDAVKWCNARSEKERRIPAYYTSAAQTTVYRAGTNDLQPSFVKWNAGYRLPTEAEWEKAARGGAIGRRFPWGEAISWDQANYYARPASVGGDSYDVNPTEGYHPMFKNGGVPYTSPVGHFAPNGFGTYDMVGNGWEWCWDWFAPYSGDPQTDPRGPSSGSYRIFRGGAWFIGAFNCRTAMRFSTEPEPTYFSIGFRSVLPASQ